MSAERYSLTSYRSGSFAGQRLRPSAMHIRAFVTKHFDYKERRGGAELVICNPLANGANLDDTGWHFNIALDKGGACHDWRGDQWARGGSKSFLNFVRLYLRCSFGEAVAAVVAAAHGQPLTADAAVDIKPVADWSIELPTTAKPFRTLLSEPRGLAVTMAVNWLQSRGVTEAEAIAYDLHLDATDVVWPYYEYGDLVYWQARSILSKTFNFPKLTDTMAPGRSEYVYGFDLVKQSTHVIVVEAIFGVHSLDVTSSNCVATGGAALSERQADKIKALNPECGVILAPDHDVAGIESIVSNATLLRARELRVFYALPPRLSMPGIKSGRTKDWNDLIEKMKWPKQRVFDVLTTAVTPYLSVSTAPKLLLMAAALRAETSLVGKTCLIRPTN